MDGALPPTPKIRPLQNHIFAKAVKCEPCGVPVEQFLFREVDPGVASSLRLLLGVVGVAAIT